MLPAAEKTDVSHKSGLEEANGVRIRGDNRKVET